MTRIEKIKEFMSYGDERRAATIARRETPVELPTLKPLVRGVYVQTRREVEAVEKHDYIRSPALMRAYRLIPCQHCGKDDGTVCGAHCNWGEGKGGAIKADDNKAAALCSTCHSMIDQGSILGQSERMAIWFVSFCKTVRELQRRGLWPRGVPVPPLEWSRIS